MTEAHWLCPLCYQSFPTTDALKADHPFQAGEQLLGCPKCRAACDESFQLVCDVMDCKRPVTRGTPTPRGYRRTCGEHAPSYDTKSEKVVARSDPT